MIGVGTLVAWRDAVDGTAHVGTVTGFVGPWSHVRSSVATYVVLTLSLSELDSSLNGRHDHG